MRITSPVTGVTDMTYSPAGQLLTRTDARGVTATNTYDAAGRLAATLYDDGVSTETLSFAYDVVGRRARAESLAAIQTFTQDRRGAVLTATQQVSGGVEQTPEYTDTLDGQVESITYPRSAFGLRSAGQLSGTLATFISVRRAVRRRSRVHTEAPVRRAATA